MSALSINKSDSSYHSLSAENDKIEYEVDYSQESISTGLEEKLQRAERIISSSNKKSTAVKNTISKSLWGSSEKISNSYLNLKLDRADRVVSNNKLTEAHESNSNLRAEKTGKTGLLGSIFGLHETENAIDLKLSRADLILNSSATNKAHPQTRTTLKSDILMGSNDQLGHHSEPKPYISDPESTEYLEEIKLGQQLRSRRNSQIERADKIISKPAPAKHSNTQKKQSKLDMIVAALNLSSTENLNQNMDRAMKVLEGNSQVGGHSSSLKRTNIKNNLYANEASNLSDPIDAKLERANAILGQVNKEGSSNANKPAGASKLVQAEKGVAVKGKTASLHPEAQPVKLPKVKKNIVANLVGGSTNQAEVDRHWEKANAVALKKSAKGRK